MSDSLPPHGLYSPWNCPGQNTGVGSLSLLQRVFPSQGSNPGLPEVPTINIPDVLVSLENLPSPAPPLSTPVSRLLLTGAPPAHRAITTPAFQGGCSRAESGSDITQVGWHGPAPDRTPCRRLQVRLEVGWGLGDESCQHLL